MVEKEIIDLEMRKYKLERLKMIVAITAVLSIALVLAYAIYENRDLEQKKLDLARDQFEVQAAQTNRSLQLQATNEIIKAIEIAMNSPLTADLLGSQKESDNVAKDLLVELIKRFNVNLNCAPLWLCDKNKVNSTTSNSSTCDCQKYQNTPKNIQYTGNNNRENISYPYARL